MIRINRGQKSISQIANTTKVDTCLNVQEWIENLKALEKIVEACRYRPNSYLEFSFIGINKWLLKKENKKYSF